MQIIAITGGIASGKSLVAKYLFDEYGAFIFDADKEAKNILMKNEVSKKVLDSFPSIKSLTLKEISEVVFKNKSNQKKLNDIIHPLVKIEIEKSIAIKKGKENIFIIDAPLIIESGMFEDLKNNGAIIVLIAAKDSIRARRALLRGGLSQKTISDRMKLQMSDEEKKKYADFVIENNSSKESLFTKVDKFFKENLG
tara:strand:- start:1748 stop:2335 length:588 start_codon:yes stop_codon:yes gene_type:complete